MKERALLSLGCLSLALAGCAAGYGLGPVKQASLAYEAHPAPPDPLEVAAKPCKYADVDRCIEQCEGGNASSCNAVGVLFEYGQGTTADSTIASGFYSRACDASYAPGCTNLGWLYSLGRGVPRDAQEAMLLFTRAFDFSRVACRRGDGRGCLMAGELLLEGQIPQENSDSLVGEECARPPCTGDGALAFFQRACGLGEAKGCDYVETLR